MKIKSTTLINIIILTVYAVLTIVCALRHEMWLDEAQGWLIGRENTASEIFALLKYEGHPPLRFLLMRMLVCLNFPVEYLPLFSVSVSIVTAALILKYAPFNTLVKCAAVFSASSLYFNSVMVRPYCLIPLFLVLIAIMYKKRNEHPIIFGTLVALLANTHIMMCGLVGMLGIFMIYELVQRIRTLGVRKSIGHIIGLAIAGIGVLCLVLPILSSLQNNRYTSEHEYTLGGLISGIALGFCDVCYSIPGYLSNSLSLILSLLMTPCVFVMLAALRHWRKAFAVSIVFSLFAFFVCNYIWCFIPNRSSLFLLTFFFIFWAAKENEAPVFHTSGNAAYKSDILKLFKKLDLKSEQVCSIALSAVLLFTAPIGAAYLVMDLYKPFALGKTVAEYVNENFDDDSVFVSYSDEITDLICYAPKFKYYSLQYSKYFRHMYNSE